MGDQTLVNRKEKLLQRLAVLLTTHTTDSSTVKAIDILRGYGAAVPSTERVR